MAAIFILAGCNKNGLLPTNGQLSASSLNAEIHQPDSLKLVGAGSADSVKWSINPAGFDSLITKNNTALVFFKKSGNYTVTAIDKGIPASITIKVNDSVYHAKQQYVTVPLTGDQITLVPHYYKSQSSDSTLVYFVAQTKNSYCGSGNINFADSVVNSIYNLGFISVTEPSPCVIGTSPIGTSIFFNIKQPQLLANGNYALTVTLNNTTYTGSFDVTSSNITFNWNYVAGVTISPKQISR